MLGFQDKPLNILQVSGDPQVAQVVVGRFGADPRHEVEWVDGLDPPRERREKWIINVSTQFGCPVGCPMCDAAGAFHGNLNARQMLDQVGWALERHPEAVTCCAKLKVHFSRMGEPSLNAQVLEALEQLPAWVGSPGLWAALATVAPQGRQHWFEALLDLVRRYPRRFQLQFSVQSTDPKARARLIPIPHLELDEIAELGKGFLLPGGRRPVLNFALAEDAPFDPLVLARHFSPDIFAVKITPINPTMRSKAHGLKTRLRSALEVEVDAAIADLRLAGYDVIRSVGDPREDEIGSNCGQTLRLLQAELSKPRNPVGSRAGRPPAVDSRRADAARS